MVGSNDPKDLTARSIFCKMSDEVSLLGDDTTQLNGDEEFSKELLSLVKKYSTAPFGPEELIFEFMVPVSLKEEFTPYFEYDKKYQGSFHRIQKGMGSKDCIEFLKNKNSILAGKQGVAFLKKMNLFFKFPKGLVVFFGEEDESNDSIVSYIHNGTSGVEEAEGASKIVWPAGVYLVSFKEV
jgi:hypothetical protein